MTTGKTIRLDGLEIHVEADGEVPLGFTHHTAHDGVKRPSLPRFKYAVTITTEDGYRYERSQTGGAGEFESGIRDFDAVAYWVLNHFSSIAEDPRVIIFGAEQVEVAKRLEPLIKRNSAAIHAGYDEHRLE
jgi:hypothetical protein